MIVSGTSLAGENGATVGADTAFKDRDTTKSNYIFSYADSKLTAATANAIARTVTLVKENHYTTATPEVKFTVEGLTLGEETQFSLYTVAVDPDAYLVYQFTPLKDAIYNRQKLGYDAAPSNLVIPVTLAIEYESDLPAESGEAPEGTEVVETTDVTEPPVTE
jgi:hypothetical protein